MRTNENAASGRCRNESCPRPVEPGEIYCDTCGLERDLYFRDTRLENAGKPTDTGRRTAGR